MAGGTGLIEELRRDRSSTLRSSRGGWARGAAAVVLAVLVLADRPAEADEFDALAAYSEAGPLNDRWQACAASYVRRRLSLQISSEALAGRALRSCRSHEGELRRFFVSRIGKRSADNVMASLSLKYRADLAAAIEDLRARE